MSLHPQTPIQHWQGVAPRTVMPSSHWAAHTGVLSVFLEVAHTGTPEKPCASTCEAWPQEASRSLCGLCPRTMAGWDRRYDLEDVRLCTLGPST